VGRVSSSLRIGEKIGAGFAVVGLLLIGVIWHYQLTLKSVLADHQQLQQVYEVRKSLALEIEVEMAAIRDAEKNFLLRHQERFADEVDRHLQSMHDKVTRLATVDQQSGQTANQLQALMNSYEQSFRAVADAWRAMGLDENSGIQGAFRQKIHRLHELSAQYDVDHLFTVLLQIRRNEKDLALRRDPAYRERVRKLLPEFRQLIEQSRLPAAVRQKLLAELTIYARAFEDYADNALEAGYDGGGKGPFRDAAQRIEAMLNAHYVPHLETSVLQLRRREKDFLLRGDESYPPMVAELARTIRSQIAESALAQSDKELLLGLLRDYQRSFLVLVSQRADITIRTGEMNAAADQVAPLIEANVAQANQMMASRVAGIEQASRASVRLGIIVTGCAIGLAVVLAVVITARIVRPVRQMAGLLDDLAYGTPTGRVPTVRGGRNEINAMGESLNALLDHRASFLGWWKASMEELRARRDVENATNDNQRDSAIIELRAASIAKIQQLNALRGRLMLHAQRMVELAQRWRTSGKLTAEDARALEHATQGMETLCAVLAVEEEAPVPAAATDAIEPMISR